MNEQYEPGEYEAEQSEQEPITDYVARRGD